MWRQPSWKTLKGKMGDDNHRMKEDVLEQVDLRLYKELERCNLCEWECNVNRLEGETGVCGITIPLVGQSCLHPAPPSSFDAFMLGCNFRCVFCQNWMIAHYPQNPKAEIEGYYEPRKWAKMGVKALHSAEGQFIRADRLFFTGGEPTPSLPWIEEVVKEARKIDPSTKVNYDTNGFLTKDSLRRVLGFATSLTYDIKAFREDTFSALTGGFVEPILRNAEYIARHAKKQLWEFRVMVIEGIHDSEIQELCQFLSDLDETLPLNFLAFRTNFAMERYHGPSYDFMNWCVEVAKKSGLENVDWSGHPSIRGDSCELKGSELAMSYAKEAGCVKRVRICGACGKAHDCDLKRYVPRRRT